MAARKKTRTQAGTTVAATPSSDGAQVPVSQASLQQQIAQLQETVNALIVRFNAHTHSGVTAGAAASGAPSAGTTHDGTAQADAALFTP